MKIVFMGTPDISEYILDRLIKSGHEISAVVTQSDKPKGRGNEVAFSPVKKLALLNSIPVLQPEKAKDPCFYEELRKYEPDLIVVAAYGKIIPKTILDMPKYGCINVHTSLLPKYRGAAPIQWVILNGEEETGVTIQYMAEGIDNGDIIRSRKVRIESDETAGTLFDKLAEVGADVLLETMDDIENGNVNRIPQNNSEATYVTIIDKSFGHIDFSTKAVEIERKIRGLDPWPSAFCYLDNKTLKLWKARVLDDKKKNGSQNGTIVAVNSESFVIKTGEGLLEILELQLEGKKRMNTADFLRGCRIQEGTVLS